MSVEQLNKCSAATSVPIAGLSAELGETAASSADSPLGSGHSVAMSSFDLVVRNASLPDGRTGLDIGVQGGKIAAVAPNLPASGAPELDAAGNLVSPPFVDPHFHLDTSLSLGKPRFNTSGTLFEAIKIWGEGKPSLTAEIFRQRALTWCDWAVGRGVGAIRSHVDIGDPRLLAVDTLLEVRREVAPYLDLQLVAFPQDGIVRTPENRARLETALDRGVEIVGGIPHYEPSYEEGAESIRILCEIAARRGLRVDMHCDENDDPMSRQIATLTAETVRCGLQGRVNASHLASMHSMDNDYVAGLIPKMVEARLSVTCSPLVNITLQARGDTYPRRRGMTRVPELMAAGLTVGFAHDCGVDHYYPLGSADMLEVASMGLHVAQMTASDAMRACFDAVTVNAARVMGLDGYGLAPGCHADFVILQAPNTIEAIRLRAARLKVVRRGKVIAENPPQTASLSLPGRPPSTSFQLPTF
jgi:cytosine/creatinine deaminase